MSVGIGEMSFMGGAMILCALVLRALFRCRLPARAQAFLWGAALARLLLPIAIPSPVSLLGFLRNAERALPAFPSAKPAAPSPLAAVWLAGAAACAFVFLASYLRGRRVLDAALPAPMTPELESLLAGQRLARPVKVYLSDRVSTPLAYGILRPRIVLPGGMDRNRETLSHVIAHECCHLKRGDAALKGLLVLAACIHWFNPLVWVMVLLAGRDMELACDRRVLKKFGPEARTAYARTLLSLEERKRFSPVIWACFSQSPLETRIRSVMAGKRAALPGVLAAVLVYGFLGVALASSPALESGRMTGFIGAMPAGYAVFTSDGGRTMTYVFQNDASLSVSRLEALSVSTVAAAGNGVFFAWPGEDTGMIIVYGAPLAAVGAGPDTVFATPANAAAFAAVGEE